MDVGQKKDRISNLSLYMNDMFIHMQKLNAELIRIPWEPIEEQFYSKFF